MAALDETVSVIVPYYNYKDYVRETLESILTQSVTPHEVIVVDDGSTDGGIDIVKEFPVKVVSKENGGLSSARNAGIRGATGKYIMSVDADDILRPDAIKEHLKLADEKSLVTLPLMAFGAENYTARPTPATIDVLLQTNVIYSNTLFPRKAWEDVGGFDEAEIMKFGWEDRLYWLECLGKGYKSVVGDYVALLWRRHSKSMSETTANPHAKELQEYIYNKCKHLALDK